MSDVLVIGAGQAGLATARHLQRRKLDFEVLEARDRVSGSWPDYYNSLTLFSPKAYSSLPDLPFPGAKSAYPRRDDVVAYLEGYARHFELPIVTGATVSKVEPGGGGWIVTTADGVTRTAKAVVVATGTFGSPFVPEIPGAESFGGRGLHVSAYRSPNAYAGQRVLVVGAANSAVQVAIELAEVANTTLVSRDPVQYKPQHLLGQDIHFWARVLGLDNSKTISDQGGAILDTGKYRRAIKAGRPERRPMFERFTQTGVVWTGGQSEPVDAVIFATGYRPHAPFLHDIPVWTPDGRPNHTAGAAVGAPGLFFMGQPGLFRFASATLRGVGKDADVVVQQIAAHLRNAKSAP